MIKTSLLLIVLMFCLGHSNESLFGVKAVGDPFANMPGLSADPNALQTPVTGSASDVISPGQEKAERKVFKNIIQAYGMARSVAKAFVEDVNALLDMAWAVQNQLHAIEQLAIQVETFAQNVENFEWKRTINNPRDFFQIIIDLEEQIMQPIDGIVYSALVTIPARQEVINESAANIKHLAIDQYHAAGDGLSTIQSWFFKQEKDAMYERQSEMAQEIIKSSSDRSGKETDPMVLAHNNLLLRRNDLALNYQWHDEQADRINNLSQILLVKTQALGYTHTARKRNVSSFRVEGTP